MKATFRAKTKRHLKTVTYCLVAFYVGSAAVPMAVGPFLDWLGVPVVAMVVLVLFAGFSSMALVFNWLDKRWPRDPSSVAERPTELRADVP